MTPIRITRAIQAAFYAYTAGILNARADYRARPTRACRRPRCDQLAADDLFCDMHRRDADAANERARANRQRNRADKERR